MTDLVIDTTTILSLALTLLLLTTAYVLSLRLLPSSTTPKIRTLYIWHLFDALIHFILEGSFLYNCFFTYTSVIPTSDYPHPASLGAEESGHFLGYHDRRYGSAYGKNAFAKLWQEYAKADKRWGGADLTVISLELLTVGLGVPLALYVTELIRSGAGQTGKAGGRASAKLWFWASVLATGELYGGFMTFAPEWLSGNMNLDTGNWMFLWVYLVFFNTLWVWFPLWVLYEAYGSIATAFDRADGKAVVSKKKA